MNNLLFSFAEIGNAIVGGLTAGLGSLWYAVLINFIGVVAIGVKIAETQNKKRNNILMFAILGYLCWVTYFILNGDFTSAMVNLIGCIQGIVFMQRDKHKWANSILWLFFFIAVQLVVAFFIWKSPFSLFSIVGGLICSVAYFIKDERMYRYLIFINILLWIGNGIVYFYAIALIHDTCSAVSILIAIVRYNILGKDKTEKSQIEKTDEQKDCA